MANVAKQENLLGWKGKNVKKHTPVFSLR